MYHDLIDIHSHILPGLDDGAKNMRQSLEMLGLCHQEGISIVIATPHYYHIYPQKKGALSRRSNALSSVNKACRTKLPIEILLGFEVFGSNDLLYRSSLGSLTLAGTPWILIERPYIYSDDFDDVFDMLLQNNLRPIIAHPERYNDFLDDFDLLQDYISHKAWSQITADALLGYKGKAVQRWCIRAIELGLVHLVASDAHDVKQRPPRLQAAAQMLVDIFGHNKMVELLYDNPERMLGLRT